MTRKLRTAAAGFLGLFQGRFARPLAVGTSLMFFQQVTGQPSVLYYASEIFEDAGFAAGAEANGISVILGVFKLIMTGARRGRGPSARVQSWTQETAT